jgi:hypothetical protein
LQAIKEGGATVGCERIYHLLVRFKEVSPFVKLSRGEEWGMTVFHKLGDDLRWKCLRCNNERCSWQKG